MADVRYICTGGCGGSVSEEEYRGGKTTCATPSCPKYGQPFERREAAQAPAMGGEQSAAAKKPWWKFW